jgi:hypothetical protein
MVRSFMLLVKLQAIGLVLVFDVGNQIVVSG